MLTTEFYKLVDSELETIFERNPGIEALHTHKDNAHNKGYAFLIWFLDFYSQYPSYQRFITDGNGDNSCDIIFSNEDSMGENVFYVVQSKWLNIKQNEHGELVKKDKKIQEFPKLNKEEFKASLADFNAVLNGFKKSGENKNFDQKSDELIAHLEKNGKAKFIFFTIAEYDNELEEVANAFRKEHAPNITLDIIDVNRIKQDYIEFKYKEIVVGNPLEYQYSPEDREIELDIERFKSGSDIEKASLENRDMLQFAGNTDAYIFLLKPKTIHGLFKKYKFSLFFKNVRNPLHRSNYNEQIVKTLQERPSRFWYFNNGITAITKLIPDVGKSASTFKIRGLQIINGAQTVYSIYQAYEKANADQREIMDVDARISFRLIRSSDEQFNLEITRFTNQQNQMEPRDFVANLDEQRRLQQESFKTNFWYEKRRGEFRNIQNSNDIRIVPSSDFALAYLSFFLQKPVMGIQSTNKLFLKSSEDSNGLYSFVFNEKTSFKDMLASWIMLQITYIEIGIENGEHNSDFQNTIEVKSDLLNARMPTFALSKVVLELYLSTKLNTKGINISAYIISASLSKNNVKIDSLIKCLEVASEFIKLELELKDGGNDEKFLRLMSSQEYYQIIAHKVKENNPENLAKFVDQQVIDKDYRALVNLFIGSS
jgi:hypothetical protein